MRALHIVVQLFLPECYSTIRFTKYAILHLKRRDEFKQHVNQVQNFDAIGEPDDRVGYGAKTVMVCTTFANETSPVK